MNNKYDIIQEVVDKKVPKTYAVVKLGMSKRQVNRLIKLYKEQGMEGFIHGNVGNKTYKRSMKK